MNHSNRRLTINATFAFLLGGALAIFAHECVHWVVGAAYGVTSTLYQFGTTTSPQLTGVPEAVTALSAPVASMVLGALAAVWLPLKRRGGFAHLLWVWTAFVSLEEGVSYMVTGVGGVGDVADGITQLGLPYWTTFPVAAVGTAGMFAVARWFASFVREWCGDDPNTMRSAAFFPWLIASPVMVAVQAVSLNISGMGLDPASAFFVSIASIAIGVFAPMSLMFAPKLTGPVAPLALPRIPWVGVVGYALTLLVNLLVLRGGIAIG